MEEWQCRDNPSSGLSFCRMVTVRTGTEACPYGVITSSPGGNKVFFNSPF